jgi:hypothetical protein
MAWAPDYVTAAELKAYLRIGDTVDDAQVALAISASSRAIDRHTNRQFGSVAAEERTYPVRWDRRRCRYVVEIDDLMSTAGLEVAGVAFDATLHLLEPRNAAQLGRPWELLVMASDPGTDGVALLEAPWGWTTTPTPVKQASLLQGSRVMARRESPFGVAGSPELGSELRLLARVDPDVAVALGPYVRWWGAR